MVAKPNVDQYEDLENQARRSRSGRDSTRLHARPADAHDGSAAGLGLSSSKRDWQPFHIRTQLKSRDDSNLRLRAWEDLEAQTMDDKI